MDVRANSTYSSSLESLGTEAASRLRAEGSSSIAPGGLAPEGDSSDLSPAAQVVVQAMQMPDIRQDRISTLQQQIASGTYQVAPHEIADAILRNLAG